MTTELRKTGVDIVGDMPWGTHFCLFYETKADLLEITVSYCKAGLENQEFCLWVVAEPLIVEDAKHALHRAVPDFDRYFADHSIEIVAARDWYLQDGTFDLNRVIGGWNEKLARASARGYAGVRVTGDTAWLEKKDWKNFCEYEESLNQAVADQSLAVLCTYPLAACGAAEILDVVRTHQFAVTKRRGSWDVIETAGHKQAKAEIKRLNEELEERVRERTSQLTSVNSELTKEILQRQRAEEALLRSEAYLAEAQRVSHTGSFAWNVSSGHIVLSDETLRILEYDLANKPTVQVILQRTHPEDRAFVQETLDQAARDRKAFGCEHRLLMPDGSVKNIRVKCHPSTSYESGGFEFVGAVTDITESKRAEEELRRSEAFLAEGQQISHTGSWGWNLVTGKIFWSDEHYRILGFHPTTAELSFNMFWERVPPENRSFVQQYLDNATQERRAFTLEYQIVHADGSIRILLTVGRPVIRPAGEIEEYIGTTMDITERKQAEEALRKAQDELRQSQKMEAIGRLAGGVAHDFNNLLGIIIGYSELLKNTLRSNGPQLEQVEQISKAAEQAASLTRNLLTFSRRQMPRHQVLELQLLLRGLEKMMRSVVGEDIELILKTDAAPSFVRSDPGQIEQAILNLVINARDAMPTGGKLTLSISNVFLDEEFVRQHPKIKMGAYVRLSVSDTGCGMDAETQARIFEPFFTTKEPGKGTGLGLATVYGTLEQAGGMIAVESEPGFGTSFHTYMPQIEEATALPAPPSEDAGSVAGSETILLVEDQDAIRSLLTHILETKGYTVFPARDGREALLLSEKYMAEIDLMITDMVMPQMSGRELARELSAIRPSMKILYISGYADRSLEQMNEVSSEFAYLEKPFSPDALMREVRAVLDTTGIQSRSA